MLAFDDIPKGIKAKLRDPLKYRDELSREFNNQYKHFVNSDLNTSTQKTFANNSFFLFNYLKQTMKKSKLKSQSSCTNFLELFGGIFQRIYVCTVYQ